MQTMTTSSMQHCIDDCLHCYRTCLQTAMNHCLEAGGRHTEPEHFRLMMNCSDICRTAAEFMLSNSPMHGPVCASCAEVCNACAQSCEQIGEMDECVQACRTCMESCRQMSGGTDMGNFTGQARSTSVLQDRLPM